MQTLGEILVIFDLARVCSLGRAAQRSASHPRRRIGRGGCVLSAGAPLPEGKGVNVRLYYLVLCVCTDWVTEWLTRPCLSRELRGGELPAAYLSTYLPTYLVQPASIDLFNPTVRGPSIRSCVLSIWGGGGGLLPCSPLGEKKETQDDT